MTEAVGLDKNEMAQYIVTKMLKGKPMTRQEYNDYQGLDLPESEKHLANEEGMLVEYEDTDHPNHIKHAGYISWSPLPVFDKAYRKTNGLSFGLAIEATKKGYQIARAGWDGKGIFVALMRPYRNLSEMTGPYLYIDTTGLQTDNPDAPKCTVPWLASQTDMLADDWFIIED